MQEFARKGINFTAVKVNEQCNVMIDVMRVNYNQIGPLQMNISDLVHASATKS
jgi:hypothetical protein